MPTALSRRRFLKSASLGVAAAVTEPVATTALASQNDIRAATLPRQALKLLIAGNRRWVTGRVTHPHQSIKRRLALGTKQHPFATIFSCIDSRVPPELVFDRGIGDLAVIGTGAQVLDEGVVFGSIEFSPDHLGTPLIMVMGHQRCGAVSAAIHTIQTGGTAPGHIQSIVDALRPAYDVAIKADRRPRRQHGARPDEADGQAGQDRSVDKGIHRARRADRRRRLLLTRYRGSVDHRVRSPGCRPRFRLTSAAAGRRVRQAVAEAGVASLEPSPAAMRALRSWRWRRQ
jgi:carbonic anhydrase